MQRLVVCTLVVFALVLGCGYEFQRSAQKAPADIRSISVPTVTNATTYTDLTNELTNGLIAELNLSKIVRVTDPAAADALLEVRVRSVQIEGAARSQDLDTSVSRRVTVLVSAVLRHTRDGKILWQNQAVSARQNYQVEDDQSVVEANLNNALNNLALKIAEKIHDGIFESF
jgi:hypothetical protein